MRRIVQIGAGAIGRGFLAELWCNADYETVFVDTDETLVAEINRHGTYLLRLVTNDAQIVREIAPVWAVWTGDGSGVREALTDCAFAATAVGARHIGDVARNVIAPALSHRIAPLNVLLCENGDTIHRDFFTGLSDATNSIGAVETVVGRMVPEVAPDPVNPLALSAEPYYELPFCGTQWRGELPTIAGLIAVPGEMFPVYHLRKLFIHNGGHACLAYHGYLRGHTHIWQCASDATIIAELRGFWMEIGVAFGQSAYQNALIFTGDTLTTFAEDLLYRFGNTHLGDTVARVARDSARKLAAHDRLVGAALFCLSHGIEPVHIARAIVAALRYDAPRNEATRAIVPTAAIQDVGKMLGEITGLVTDHPLLSLVRREAR